MHTMAKPRGRAPKPVAAHKLQGTYQAVRHEAREKAEPPAVGELSPTPPEWMCDTGKRVWIATLPFLVRGVVGASDTHLLAAFCNQVATLQKAVRAQALLDQGKELPFLAKGKDGQPVASPYLRISRQATALVASLASDLGLTPIARARIGALAYAPDAPPMPASEDPWGAFKVIKGGRGG